MGHGRRIPASHPPRKRRRPSLLPNGTVVMLFKLCRYPPNCPRGPSEPRQANFTNAETLHSDPSTHTVRHTASPHCQLGGMTGRCGGVHVVLRCRQRYLRRARLPGPVAHFLRVKTYSACKTVLALPRPIAAPTGRPRTATPPLLIALPPRTAYLTRHVLSQAKTTARSPSGPSFSFFVPGLPHVTLIELRLALISYQDYHMSLLTLAGHARHH